MADLLPYQYFFIGILFIWSGFVRSGLGFGGAILSLPFLLLVVDDPLLFLPLIGAHLLFSSLLIIGKNQWRQHTQNSTDASNVTSIDWPYLRYALKIMLIPKLIGVFGLLTLPASLMNGIIYCIVLAYAASYILDRPFVSQHRSLDIAFLALGGYVSGTSLIGAPLIVAVFARRVDKNQLRDTLFLLWLILVSIKMVSFIAAGVDLQLIHHLWLLPCAYLGHLLGERAHQRILQAGTRYFYRIIGWVLVLVSSIGLAKVLT